MYTKVRSRFELRLDLNTTLANNKKKELDLFSFKSILFSNLKADKKYVSTILENKELQKIGVKNKNCSPTWILLSFDSEI